MKLVAQAHIVDRFDVLVNVLFIVEIEVVLLIADSQRNTSK